MRKSFTLLLVLSLIAASFSPRGHERAQAAEDEYADAATLAVTVESNTEIVVDDFSQEELIEAEPSEIPSSTEVSLTDDLGGMMLLDVEGHGEVYYNVLPEDSEDGVGGKEYLADGKAAYSLLQRRALGINEENFAKLTISDDGDEESVCRTSPLGNRLKGRIVIRVEMHGEAYYIYPKNCRTYYTGTFEAAYELMKKLSLGITKNNLARVRDQARQKAKTSYRHLVYAVAEDQDITLDEAKTLVKAEVAKLHECLKKTRGEAALDANLAARREAAKNCAQQTSLPRIGLLKIQAIKNAIQNIRANEDISLEERLQMKLRILKARVEAKNATDVTGSSGPNNSTNAETSAGSNY